MKAYSANFLAAIVLPAASPAAGLQLSVTNLSEFFHLQSDASHTPIVSNMNERGEFLHATSFIPPEGGTAQATEAYIEHRDGTRTRFEVPYSNAIFSELRLNNNGEVAAIIHPDKANLSPLSRELWVYTSAGAPAKIEGFIGGLGMENLSFNDAGQVAVSNSDEDRAYRYTPGIGWEPLGSLANDGFAKPSWGNSINNAGAVTGATSVGASNLVTPFLARPGQAMEDIPAPFGTGRAINDNFVVTGDGGWVWHANELRMDYIFNNQAYGFIRPRDINNLGAIIGISEGSASFEQIAFYWNGQDGVVPFESMLTDPTWTINDAFAINDDGWILAYGHYGDDRLNDAYAWLLLKPVPEPGGVALLLGGSVLVFRRRRRRTVTLCSHRSAPLLAVGTAVRDR